MESSLSDGPIPSVGVLVRQIKFLLEGQFRLVEVTGEVTNLSRSAAGHVYFNLSDREAMLHCAFFRMNALRNPHLKNLQDGDCIKACGQVGVYLKRGQFQLIVEDIAPLGKGDLKDRLEELKRKLAGEGLFDPQNKRDIPTYPKRIGLITAEKGAALQDFLNITRRRTLWMDILLSPALVQGEAAPSSLRQALSRLLEYHRRAASERQLDIIVLTRGGGSLEDLWAFNDENLARDIYHCPLPVVSAVGHQVDFSISDMVADLRCETPSAAAEILSSGQAQLKETFQRLESSVRRSGRELAYRMEQKLNRYHPQYILDGLKERCREGERRLERANPCGRLTEFCAYYEKLSQLEDLSHRLQGALPLKLADGLARLEKNHQVLKVLNPQNVLQRGYSYLQDSRGEVVLGSSEFEKLGEGERLEVVFRDGRGNVQKCGSREL